jgi:phosphotransferase system enzyme I (PtsI)
MIVDGMDGVCYLEPDSPTLAEMLRKQEGESAHNELLDSMRGLPTVTKGGRAVKLCSNIGSVDDLSAVLHNDSEGIGLFRSEFLYLGRDDYPTEDELFGAYRKVAEGMGGKQVVIRTLDIGADKRVGYFNLDDEENPALGLRGVRICIDRPEVFKTQLRAIYRASAFGSVAVMFPMIASLWEVLRCKEIAAEVRDGLAKEGVSIGEVELGIMIETPAAAVISNELAKEVDFFSVGTNDLTQYTIAIDRQNEKLEQFYDPYHPAILELLRIIAGSAAANGIWAGVCGELAADPKMTSALVGMGYHELSVSPVFTLETRKRIRELE